MRKDAAMEAARLKSWEGGEYAAVNSVLNTATDTAHWGWVRGFSAGYNAAIEALEYKERAEWIPVEQNPNPQSGQYLVTVYAGFVTEAYRTDRWYQAADDVEMNAGNFNEVIAYCRLPEPYEGGTR